MPIEECDSDIINLHNILGHYINIKILFDYLRKNISIVWTFNDVRFFSNYAVYIDYLGDKELPKKVLNSKKVLLILSHL